MTLIKSISGIRGTIGGEVSSNLTPIDIVKFTTAYAVWNRNQKHESNKIVVGRDARLSGKMVENIVVSTLISMGFDVINIGMATTPTTEVAVITEKAAGGIIITASHNPKQWNALKLLNCKGEFLSDSEGKEVLRLAESKDIVYNDIDHLGSETKIENYEDKHIDQVLNLKFVDVEAIRKANFKVVVDCVNSVGGIVLPKLLRRLGVNNIVELNCEANGHFAHTPEPIPENLTQIASEMPKQNASVGFVVDPDVDRLAIICENGEMFGEEYTLVSVADYILSKTPGNTVSNMSSTRALRDVTEKYGCQYNAAAVGEVNVVTKMKATNAIIGGEGNGGVILPEAHYGRDALVGIALFLSLMAEKKMKVSELRKTFPEYCISKNKIQLNEKINVDNILETMANKYHDLPISTIDGVKIEFPETKEWVHLRKSNTEPIIRIYSESQSLENADKLARKIMTEIEEIIA
ncbi:MAG: phosphoglucosamine mutase [Bacteroidales bacterium]|nr:phosphoglucosamine mutase [Bacteroidales bacterium]